VARLAQNDEEWSRALAAFNCSKAGSGSHVVRVTQLDRFDGIIAALVDGDFREAAF